ncbi:MAG: polyprenyl synthetase family protein [Caldilineaceae bacterium]|nr:polyprenyl synthetase family protein [Caldilineaceae bacterium]
MASSPELSSFVGYWLPLLESEMRAVLHNGEAVVARHYGMIHYHMGWVDEAFVEQKLPSGKRLRPLLCLLACAEVGGDPGDALPAAAGIEILHNFSLVHDDIEDGDEVRRHRATVWKIWGIAQGINVGDAMFSLAYAALQRLPRRGVSAETTLAALDLFTQTNLALTEGQHLDIDFEQRDLVSVDEYLRMIQGKTAALIGASVAIGALIGGATAEQDAALQRFGQSMGLAFQIQDDILGIWGDPTATGKSAGNDVLRRKKSLPLLYALNQPEVGERLQRLLDSTDFGSEQLPEALTLLAQSGARQAAEAEMARQHHAGIAALERALGPRARETALFALSDSLLNRTT